MKRSLQVSSKITLTSMGQPVTFCIDEVVGVGGSCIAYKVSYFESEDIMHKGILKEFCPAFLSQNGTFEREGHSIVVPDAFKLPFAEELEKFKTAYRDINHYLSANLSATNYHTVQMGLYEGNNTLYTLTSCDYGKSYDKVKDTDLCTILRLMLSVTKAVEMYHNAGFLHLDIKPKNILILDDVADIIKLFDFDSLTPIDTFKGRGDVIVPVPEDYYVPELVNCDVRNIGVHTDIFEIGATLFLRIFGRAPKPAEMQQSARVNLDTPTLLTGISPQAKFELQTLFAKTIQISKRLRYQTTAELKEQLTKIIGLVSATNAPYLLNLPKWQPSIHCIGRGNDLKDLKQRLDADGYVFVSAMGGLGKSELAKLFANKYGEQYHTVQFCKYNDSLRSLVASMPIKGINDDDYTDFDVLVKEKNKVLHLSDSHTLLIVDNFNVTHDDFLREFLPANNQTFKVIFTTRCIPAADYYSDKVYKLGHLSFEDCVALFCAHTQVAESGYKDACLRELMETIDYNTLVLVLLALSMKKSGLSLEEMLNKLKNQKLDDVQTKIFHEYDFSSEEAVAYNKMNAHLNTIFSVSKLTDNEKEILKNMTLIPYEGIDANDFVECCDCDTINKEQITSLVMQGWIKENTETDISLHPVISDLLAANDKLEKGKSYYNLAAQIEEYCNPDYLNHISVVMLRLSYAIQLDRRYAFESNEKQICAKVKLGRLYVNIYRPNEAKKFLMEALALSQSTQRCCDLPYIYRFLGEVEKEFGTTGAAINYFKLSIAEGKKLKNRDYEIALESMIQIAECYAENNDNIEAYKQYKDALQFARFHFLKEDIFYIAAGLVEVCHAMDWLDKAAKYRKLRDKYRPTTGHEAIASEMAAEEAMHAIKEMADAGDCSGAMRRYEEFLVQKREQLGEDSPLYKDIAQSRWIYYTLANDTEQAMRLISEHLTFVASTYGKESMEMANQLSLIAMMAPKLQDYAYAVECAKKAIEICENKGELHSYSYFQAKLALAQTYMMLGRLEDAKSSFCDVNLHAFSGNEALSDFVTTAGLVLCELSEYEKVETLCTELLGKSNIYPFAKAQAHIMMAIIREQCGLLEEAEQYAQEAFDAISNLGDITIKNEWLVQYYRAAARIQYRKGDYTAAINTINAFIALFPEEKREEYILYGPFLERGLYYSQNGQAKESEMDYETCEKILKANHMPEECFVHLYNNISKNQIEAENYISAQTYLDRIVCLRPAVIEPTSYTDGIVCNNIGWVALMLEDLPKSEEFLLKAIRAFERIQATNNMDYLSILHNLALLYEKKNKSDESIKIYETVFSSYDAGKDANGDNILRFDECFLRNMMIVGRHKEAYDFACKEEGVLAQRFGAESKQRIDILLAFGAYFKAYGYTDSMYFFRLADEAIEQGGYRESIYYAKLLNYIGTYLTDFDNEHGLALNYFTKAKALFESLGEEKDPLYTVVLSNIQYAENKNMDALISKMAESMMNENTEE